VEGQLRGFNAGGGGVHEVGLDDEVVWEEGGFGVAGGPKLQVCEFLAVTAERCSHRVSLSLL